MNPVYIYSITLKNNENKFTIFLLNFFSKYVIFKIHASLYFRCAKQNPLEKAMDSDSKRTDMSGEENKLFIDKKTFHEIMSYRDCYASYLERTKKGNFDPCTVTNT